MRIVKLVAELSLPVVFLAEIELIVTIRSLSKGPSSVAISS